MTPIYDGQFGGNILVVGRTGCGNDIPDENDVTSLFGENKKNGLPYCYGRRFERC